MGMFGKIHYIDEIIHNLYEKEKKKRTSIKAIYKVVRSVVDVEKLLVNVIY